MSSIWRSAPGRLRRRGPGIGALVLIALLAFALLTGRDGDEAALEAGDRVEADVMRVIDGDTIEVSLDGVTEDVRYIGVDTPETVAPEEPIECFGKRSARFNERLVDGHTVRLTFDRERRDRYDRLLAYVHVDGTFVNAELVRRGYARTLRIEPNTSRARQLERLEAIAGRAGRGLWGSCPQTESR